MCKGDQRLWVEYFRMELLYVRKLLARRQVLGIHTQEDSPVGKAAVSLLHVTIFAVRTDTAMAS
jgi:hypothetical protein